MKAFARFWYDFIIGDDWKIAAAVVAALVVLGAVVVGTSWGGHALTVLGGVLVFCGFAGALFVDVRGRD
jgi:hypothetical protein